ncbi:3-dehydroquinate dehydratase [Actibacterium mucosum KCTC 23349]|uniref:3-dehydroquinate dehydratase n=1 Tax=Actibacterium mucosum KCTC 23349 TaxID=1454373 RepID=A0A037ZL15_9RHOB|nr:type II 3-dehydroquinate dehydratase [Actibacterium mucosum]KAJ56237.1 3-dehydroquinate dehydratase [Actibacterium mucosum KCTC 23349]
MSTLIYILNGPNLNLLGKRETDIYGTTTLEAIADECSQVGAEFGLQVKMLQSNSEGQLVDWIHDAREEAAGIIINPAAYSHTSVALYDALNTFDGPVLEVHISNIHKREKFRHHSFVSPRAEGVMAGYGPHGYALSMRHMARLLKLG